MLTHGSRLVPNMSVDIRGHEALLPQSHRQRLSGLRQFHVLVRHGEPVWPSGKADDVGSILFQLSFLLPKTKKAEEEEGKE